MTLSPPPEVEQALGPLVRSLAAINVSPVSWVVSESFGNLAVTFRGQGKEFQVTRDRGQFMVWGPESSVLERAGLSRTFPGFRELEPPLLQWLASARVA